MNDSVCEELILYIYGELDELRRKSVESKLQASAALRAELQELKASLEKLTVDPIPEKPADYGQTVWRAIEQDLPAYSSKNKPATAKPSIYNRLRAVLLNFSPLPRAIIATSVLIAVFYLGTLTNFNQQHPIALDQLAQTWSQTSGEEIYKAQLASYLEQSNRLFTELNQQSDDNLNLSQARQAWVGDMLVSNRLYRVVARDHGDHQVAALLEQMETLLLELKNLDRDSPANQRQQELNNLRMRVQDQDLVYKVRYVQQQYQQSSDWNNVTRQQL